MRRLSRRVLLEGARSTSFALVGVSLAGTALAAPAKPKRKPPEGHGVISLNGETVMFNSEDYRLPAGAEALVAGGESFGLRVATIAQARTNATAWQWRQGIVHDDDGKTVLVKVIGRVIGRF